MSFGTAWLTSCQQFPQSFFTQVKNTDAQHCCQNLEPDLRAEAVLVLYSVNGRKIRKTNKLFAQTCCQTRSSRFIAPRLKTTGQCVTDSRVTPQRHRRAVSVTGSDEVIGADKNF